MAPHVIALTANDRPAYMRRVLDSWAACPGIQQADLTIRCEPGCLDMFEVAESADQFCDNATVTRNPSRLGPLTNPYVCFEEAFKAGADFVIVGEDDTIVARDVLGFFTAADAMYRARPEVLAVCPFRHHAPENPDPAAISLSSAFESTVWGTWRDRWDDILRDTWDHTYARRGFDWNIQQMADDLGFVFAQPEMSRAQHIGEHGGTHCQPEQFKALESTCFDQSSLTWHFHPGTRPLLDRPARESV